MMSFKPSLLQFKFAKFADLPQERGKGAWSKQLADAQGRPWQLQIFPVGGSSSDVSSDSTNPKIALFLCNKGDSAVHATVTYVLRDEEGVERLREMDGHTYQVDECWGTLKWISLSGAIEALDNEGTLSIGVLVQVKPPSCYVPPNPLVSKMVALFDEGTESDVTFEVGDCLIPAHKLIIQASSQELCDGIGGGKTPILIEGISKEAFLEFLRCLYGGSVSESLPVEVKEGMILAADRFNAPHVKIAAEASLVEDCIMNDDKVLYWYELAHYKTCPLLKEQAALYFILRSPSLLRSAHFECKLKESPELMAELMSELIKEMSDYIEETGNKNTRVNELRNELARLGLDVDGSKEILMSRLQSSKKKSREE